MTISYLSIVHFLLLALTVSCQQIGSPEIITAAGSANNSSNTPEDAITEVVFPEDTMTSTEETSLNANVTSNNLIIPGQYIVFYKRKADRPSLATAQQQRLPFRIIRELRKAIAVAGMDDEQYQQMLQDPAVEKVVPDFTITIDENKNLFRTTQITCSGLTQTSCGLAEVAQSSPANWGLDRIDQDSLPLDNSYTTRCDGARVQVYVLDSGIRKSHVEFGGRATCGANYVSGEACQDFDGHGTHVAGTIGGATYGVAKRVEILDVKVFNRDGVGALSTVLAGLEYVVSQKQRNPNIPMVVNMSLGSVGTSNEIRNAVDEAVAAGIVVVVAAGNKGMDACNYSPAFVPLAITVGATDRQDARPTWSNFGSCVDLSAPGVQILSAYFTNDRATALLSGTSMSAPHVAGAAALYLQANPSWTPAQVWQAMRNDASDSVQGTARLMLQTQFI